MVLTLYEKFSWNIRIHNSPPFAMFVFLKGTAVGEINILVVT
jgi:hypothetical protein